MGPWRSTILSGCGLWVRYFMEVVGPKPGPLTMHCCDGSLDERRSSHKGSSGLAKYAPRPSARRDRAIVWSR